MEEAEHNVHGRSLLYLGLLCVLYYVFYIMCTERILKRYLVTYQYASVCVGEPITIESFCGPTSDESCAEEYLYAAYQTSLQREGRQWPICSRVHIVPTHIHFVERCTLHHYHINKVYVVPWWVHFLRPTAGVSASSVLVNLSLTHTYYYCGITSRGAAFHEMKVHSQ